MALSKLLDPDDTTYFRENTIGPGAPLFFLHIPKTAGSSFGREMRSRLKPNANLVFNYKNDSRPMHLQLPYVVDRFLARPNRSRVRFASGHIQFVHACRIKVVEPATRLVTFLRRPIDRMISDYRYQSTDAHPLKAKFVAEYPTFGDFIVADGPENKMHKFLCAYRGEPVDDVISRLTQKFTFVGTVEHYEIAFQIITALIGKVELPSIVANKTNNTEAPSVDPTPQQLKIFNDKNALDIQLYEHFSELLKSNKKLLENKLQQR